MVMLNLCTIEIYFQCDRRIKGVEVLWRTIGLYLWHEPIFQKMPSFSISLRLQVRNIVWLVKWMENMYAVTAKKLTNNQKHVTINGRTSPVTRPRFLSVIAALITRLISFVVSFYDSMRTSIFSLLTMLLQAHHMSTCYCWRNSSYYRKMNVHRRLMAKWPDLSKHYWTLGSSDIRGMNLFVSKFQCMWEGRLMLGTTFGWLFVRHHIRHAASSFLLVSRPSIC